MSASDFNLIRPIVINDAVMTSSNVPENDYTAYNSGTTYALGNRALYIAANKHWIIESLQNSNTGHTPTGLSSDPWWLLVNYDNRWQMFDQVYNTQTTNNDTIVVSITPGELVNSIALLNVEAASVTVSQSISGYSSSQSLASHPVLNWYDWFYEELLRTGDAVFTDIPPVVAGVLTITIDNTGDTAKCGVCVVGKSKILGATQWDATRTINDYSVASEDDFGDVTLLQRSYSKRLNMEFRVTPGLESDVTRILELFRATPLVFVGSSDYAMTIIYGFLGAWEVPISQSGKLASVQIKGLI